MNRWLFCAAPMLLVGALGCSQQGVPAGGASQDDINNALAERIKGVEAGQADIKQELGQIKDAIGAANNPRVGIRIGGIVFCPDPSGGRTTGSPSAASPQVPMLDVHEYNKAAVDHVNKMQEALNGLRVNNCPSSGSQGLGVPTQLPPCPGAPLK